MLKTLYHFFVMKPVIGLIIVFFLLTFSKFFKKLFTGKIFTLIFISLPAIIFFISILRNNPFFSWDDFDHLRLVYANSYFGILQMALSKPGIWVGHHIIFGFWLFKVIYDFFGTNIYPYITIMFLLNLVSVLLFYAVGGEFIKNRYIRIVSAFVFGLFYLTWISNIHELLGAIFLLLSFYGFVRWIKKANLKLGIWAITFYLIAIFSKEITFLAFPFMILLFVFMRKGRLLKKDLKILIPFLLIFVFYSIFFASTFLGYFGQNSGYKMGFNLMTFNNNLSYYLKFVMPGISIIYPFAIAVLVAIYAVTIYLKEYWGTIFLSGFFLFLLPALFFSDRVAPYYMYVPAIFLLLSFGKIGDFLAVRVKGPISVLVMVFILLCVFNADTILKDNIYLAVFPWPNEIKTQFLGLISGIGKFESGGGGAQTFKLGEKNRELVSTHGADVVEPFLSKQTVGLYTYKLTGSGSELIITKK